MAGVSKENLKGDLDTLDHSLTPCFSSLFISLSISLPGFQTTIDLTQYRKNIDYQKPGSLQPNYQFSSSSFGAPPSESRESPVTTGNNVMGDDTDKTHDGKSRRKRNVFLRIDTGVKNNDEPRQSTPATNASATPKTPTNLRGSRDLRSPGGQLTPVAQVAKLPQGSGLPDFITQTDANGNAITPRSNEAIQGARIHRSTDQKSKLNSDGNKDPSGNSGNDSDDSKNEIEDPCDMFFENLRAMCCCLVDDHHMKLEGVATDDTDVPVKLLGPHHPDDVDKPCLVLDLDETLVHSSFRAVPNSDFVIPVRVRIFDVLYGMLVSYFVRIADTHTFFVLLYLLLTY